MRQNFRRQYYHLITDPALPLILPLCLLYALGLGLSCPFLWVPALVLVLALALWQKFFRVGIGRNFQALPALPGGYRTIGQRVQKGSRVQTCGELRRSLIEDSRDAITRIPAGRYQALTHEAVLRRLERSTRVSVEKIFPAYMGTLRPVLLAQTHKRCRHCKAPCSAREAPVRWFYLVQFCVAENKEEVTMKKQTLFCRIEKLLNKFSKKAGKKVVSIIFIACISIGLFVIPASAITYEATFMYYLLDP